MISQYLSKVDCEGDSGLYDTLPGFEALFGVNPCSMIYYGIRRNKLQRLGKR